MRFQPKTEEEIDLENMLEPGEYDFEVIAAEEATSKSGNEMIKAKLKLFTDGGDVVLTDYLLEAAARKLRHFCEVTGLLDEYKTGRLTAEGIVGACGCCKVVIEPAKNGYRASNKVDDYVKGNIQATKPAAAPARTAAVVAAPANGQAAPLGDQDLPF
jgi:hypothetical protein